MRCSARGLKLLPVTTASRLAIRAEHHAQRPIVHFDVRASRREQLAVRHDDAAVSLHANLDVVPDPESRRRERCPKQENPRNDTVVLHSHSVLPVRFFVIDSRPSASARGSAGAVPPTS